MKNKLEFAAPKVHDTVLSLIPKTKKLTILDAGCGSGILSFKLKNKGHTVICADIVNMLHFKLPFKKLDLNKQLPFKNNFFDLILCVEVIEHLENPRHLLREFKRILKKGGKIILTTPNILHFISRVSFFVRGVLWGFSEKQYKTNRHITPLSFKDIRRICSELNLKIQKYTFNRGVFIIPPFIFEIPIKNFWFGEILIVEIQKN